MRGFVNRTVLRVIGTFGASCALIAGFGMGVASADPLAGQTYADAAAKVSQAGATAVVATVNGGELPIDECIVVSSQKSSSRDSSGRLGDPTVLLHLNCHAALAGPGTPGISAATPGGREQKKMEQQAEVIQQTPDICMKNEETIKYCQNICNKTGDCELPS
jgi:hypothetical protein